MNKERWIAALRGFGRLLGQTAEESWEEDGVASHWHRGSWWQGMAGRSPQIMEIEEEVAAEQRGRLVLVSRQGDIACQLLARLRQQAALPMTNTISREGFFTLIRLPRLTSVKAGSAGEAESATDRELETEHFAPEEEQTWSASVYGGYGWYGADVAGMVMEAATEADILLYLFAQQTGWQEEDARWYARLRVLGTPLLPVIVRTGGEDAPGGEAAAEAACQALHRVLGVRPVVVDGYEAAVNGDCGDASARSSVGGAPTSDQPVDDLLALLNRILGLRPRLALPLAQEAPWCRPLIASRVIRTGAVMTMLVGAEPIPLLDLPLHVAIQWKVALQLAAIYGRPGLDYRSREMVGTVLLNLCMRQVAQQALKVIPLIGWLLSGLLSGVSTWLLGSALRRYYEQEQLWDWQGVRQQVGVWRRRRESRVQSLGSDSPQSDSPESRVG